MSDDHTTQAFGIYGSRLAKLDPTPTLDKLGRNGMIFDNAFCTNSICTPSRATIMTGQYSQTNGVLDLGGSLDSSKQYLPKELSKLGYETAIIGKWHLVKEPAAFDHYEVLPVQGKYFNPTFRVQGERPWPENTVEYTGHSTDIITNLSIKWLKDRKQNKPFFLMHHYKAPHDDFEFAPRYADYLKDAEIPEPGSLYTQPNFGSEATRGKNDSLIHRIGTSIGRRHQVRSYADDYHVPDSLTDDEAKHYAYQEYLKRYLRCVKGVDDNLGRLFNYLQGSGQMENTIIIYTGDQGFMLGEHDYMDKRWMYEESMRMPLLIHYPKKIDPGRRADLLVNNADFAPTMIELAGGHTPKYMQGQSLKPLLLNGQVPGQWRQETYYRYWMHMMHHDNPAHFGIRTKEYKLIFYYGLPYDQDALGKPSMAWKENSFTIEQTPAAWELYDLRNDPYEVNNVYDDPKYTEIVTNLKKKLKQNRERLDEGDNDFPHIQQVIDQFWNM